MGAGDSMIQEHLEGRKCLSEPPDFGDLLHGELGFEEKKPIRGFGGLGWTLRGGNGGLGSIAEKSGGEHKPSKSPRPDLILRHRGTPRGQGPPHSLHHPS